MNPLFRKDPMLSLATDLGFEIRPGRKHWIAIHTNGRTIIPFGRKRHSRSERNIKAALYRATLPTLPP